MTREFKFYTFFWVLFSVVIGFVCTFYWKYVVHLFLLPGFLAFFQVVISRPLKEKFKIPRMVIHFFLTFVPLFGVMYYAGVKIPSLLKEDGFVASFVMMLKNDLYPLASQRLHDLSTWLNSMGFKNEIGETLQFGAWATESGVHLAKYIFSGVGGATYMYVLTLIATFLLATSWEKVTGGLVGVLKGIIAEKGGKIVDDVVSDVSRYVAKWGMAQLTIGAILSMTLAIFFEIFGVQNGWILGIFAGIFCMIPVLGLPIAWVAVEIISFYYTGLENPDVYLNISLIMLVAYGIETKFLSPYIVGEALKVEVYWVLVTIILMGAAGGFIGLLLAMPTLITVKALWRAYVADILDDIRNTPSSEHQTRWDAYVNGVLPELNRLKLSKD